MNNTITAGLREWMSFEPGYIQKVACEDEVDARIVTCLVQRVVGGMLPSAIARDLAMHGLKRWAVTRRVSQHSKRPTQKKSLKCRHMFRYIWIQRMNKKLMKELGQKVAEKRGHCWAPTSFVLCHRAHVFC